MALATFSQRIHALPMSMFLGVAGTYRQNDSVDVVYEQAGRRMVATGLPIVRT